MKTLAYLRISGDKQDLKNQKFEIMEYAQNHNLQIEEFLEIEISTKTLVVIFKWRFESSQRKDSVP